jgi:dTDP-4-amino-4,6-dideoxygalactose transaminase/intein/homing endonuclease
MSTTTHAARLDWPLMKNNIARQDLDAVCALLNRDDPVLTQAANVRAFEEEWSDWLGVRYSVFVNSGSSANLVTLAALRERHGPGGEVIVPTITWVSDIAAVLHCGFEPVFVDIDPRTLGMDTEQVLERITPRTRAVFLTHVLGYNALTRRLLDELARRGIPLLEDVCESHGAVFEGRKLGTFGLASNFSFYYAHHMSCAPDTPIPYLDSDGLLRIAPIEELYNSRPAGLQVFAFDDRWNTKVIKPSAVIRHNRHGKQMYRLKLKNNRSVDITEDHSVFAWDSETMRTRVVPGSRIKVGDYVVAPRRLPSPNTVRVLDFLGYCRSHAAERFFVRGFARANLRSIEGEGCPSLARRAKGGRLRSNYASRGAMPLTRVTDFSGNLSLGIKRQRCYNYVPAAVPVSPALARFLGFFVAEGSYNRHSVRFSFHIDEKEYVADVLRTGHEVFGLEGSLYELPAASSAVVRFDSPALRLFLEEFLGTGAGAKNKRVPRHVFHFPEECKIAFLYGLFRGDGSSGKEGRQYLGSASRQLLNDVSFLCSMLGVSCSLYAGRPSQKVIAGKQTSSDGVHRLYVGRWDFTLDGRLVEVARHPKGLPETSRLVPVNGSLHAGLIERGYQGVRYHKTVSLNVVGRKAPELLDELPALKRLYEADLCLLEVKGVEPVEAGYEYVYDISVPGLENFIAGWQPVCLHNSTIEGGMVCTNSADFYETARMLRAHGLVRELDSDSRKREMADEYPDLNPDFIFACAGYNVRSTEINAVIGRSQLKRLDAGIARRSENLRLFLDNLDPSIYHTNFLIEGSSNYALTLVLRRPDARLCERVMACLREHGVEFRRGTAGGGNQVRQPYLRRIVGPEAGRRYPHADHVHFYGFYLGNYPTLERERILDLCRLLNDLAR